MMSLGRLLCFLLKNCSTSTVIKHSFKSHIIKKILTFLVIIYAIYDTHERPISKFLDEMTTNVGSLMLVIFTTIIFSFLGGEK